jgi:hypothetical protein
MDPAMTILSILLLALLVVLELAIVADVTLADYGLKRSAKALGEPETRSRASQIRRAA